MDLKEIKHTIHAHRAELEALGVERLSVFGSTSRGERTPQSDVDIAVMLAPAPMQGAFAYVAQIEAINDKLEQLLRTRVDVVSEPVRKPSLQAAIEQDRVRVY